ATVLLLSSPEQRDHRRGLLARRVLCNGLLGPGEILGRELKARRLIWIETSDGHGSLETKEIGKVRSRPQRSRAAVEATPAEPGFSRDALSHPVSAALMAQPSLHRKTTRCSRTICSNG